MGAMDDYLAGLARPEREALQHLRELVHAELPQVLEVTSYNLPGFAVDQRRSSRIVGGFAAGRRYRSWYTVSGRTVERFAPSWRDSRPRRDRSTSPPRRCCPTRW